MGLHLLSMGGTDNRWPRRWGSCLPAHRKADSPAPSCFCAQPDLVRELQSPAANISMENHEFGLPPNHYELWPELAAAFDILTTTKDRRGVEYVSTIEHKHFPFFGSQVHARLPLR